MPVTILDLVVIGIVLISALLAMVRGFTREVLAIGSWAVAAVVAYFGWPKAAPLVMQYVVKQQPMLVNGLALGGVFLATLFIAYIITSKLSDFILDSRVGALDRTLGFIFGAARGFLLAVIGFGFFTWLVNENQQPAWIKGSKFKPYLESSFNGLKNMLPDNLDERIGSIKQMTDELKSGTPGPSNGTQNAAPEAPKPETPKP